MGARRVVTKHHKTRLLFHIISKGGHTVPMSTSPYNPKYSNCIVLELYSSWFSMSTQILTFLSIASPSACQVQATDQRAIVLQKTKHSGQSSGSMPYESHTWIMRYEKKKSKQPLECVGCVLNIPPQLKKDYRKKNNNRHEVSKWSQPFLNLVVRLHSICLDRNHRVGRKSFAKWLRINSSC